MTRHSESTRLSRADDERLLAVVAQAVEAFVSRRTDVDVEDVVQEAMTRLLENRSRLEPDAWTSYAVVSAGNLLRDRARTDAVQQRHAHRLHAPDVSASPEDNVLTDEEHEAVRRALAAMDSDQAHLLDEHHARQERSHRSLAPATAARLARARAKLRVAYVLEHGRVPLPTERCRPVLEAMSTGDRRRQERLGAGRHLLACAACASYAPALRERRRALAALNPLSWLAIGAGAVWAGLRRSPGRSATAGAVVVAAGAAGVLLLPASTEVPPVPPASPVPAADGPAYVAGSSLGQALVVAGRPVFPLSGALPVGAASATDVAVQAVSADEGFWVGTGPGQRVWVELVGAGESPAQVSAGDRVSFTGTAVRSGAGYAERIGLPPEQGSVELATLGGHIEVRFDDLDVRSP